MRFILDRFEEGKAVLEDMETLETRVLDASELPADAGAGDVVLYEDGRYTVDAEATEARRQAIREKFERLKCKDS
jgi:hypothetical protein